MAFGGAIYVSGESRIQFPFMFLNCIVVKDGFCELFANVFLTIYIHFVQFFATLCSAPMYQPQNQKPVKVSNGLGTDAKIDATLHQKTQQHRQQQKLILIFSQNNEWFPRKLHN